MDDNELKDLMEQHPDGEDTAAESSKKKTEKKPVKAKRAKTQSGGFAEKLKKITSSKLFKRIVVVTIICSLIAATVSMIILFSGKDDEFTSDNKLILRVANLAMTNLNDSQTAYLENKFQVKFRPITIPWNDWDSYVHKSINGNDMPDIMQWDLRSYYKSNLNKWVEGGMLRPLPDDMSQYENLSRLVSGYTALEQIKVKGKLYCFPVARSAENNQLDLITAGYIYRRDWAKDLGVYQENDEYTVEQFEALLSAFRNYTRDTKMNVLADVEWAFPSITFAYKESTTPYIYDAEQNKYVWNFTTPSYDAGIKKAKSWTDAGYYYPDQYLSNDTDVLNQYKASRMGVLYENITIKNYSDIRKSMQTSELSGDALNDATAILKLKRADGVAGAGKFFAEQNDNWWSASLISSRVSDFKMNKILEIMDYLASEEGTKFCAYGIKGQDWTEDENGELILKWAKDEKGEYIEKDMGTKGIRYMVCIGEDLYGFDPLISEESKAIAQAYIDFLYEKREQGELYVIPLDQEMAWLSAKNKDKYGYFLEPLATAVDNYMFGAGLSKWNEFNNQNKSAYEAVLEEINQAIKKA
ncbi:MAG: hypothetical protein QM214_00995 [Bacillota bacterium]|jgi:hypothetical protein|nr:hypothetical protein [Bacillota bacterium]